MQVRTSALLLTSPRTTCTAAPALSKGLDYFASCGFVGGGTSKEREIAGASFEHPLA
jgi:hypothetical protein